MWPENDILISWAPGINALVFDLNYKLITS